MGVRLRVSRNVSAYFPWWLVILAYMVWAPIYLAIWIVGTIIWCIVQFVKLIRKEVENGRERRGTEKAS